MKVYRSLMARVHALDSTRFDLAAATVIAVIGVLECAIGPLHHGHQARAVTIVAVILFSATIAFRTRSPFIAAVVSFAILVVQQLFDGDVMDGTDVVVVVPMLFSYTFGSRFEGRQLVIGLGICLAGIWAAVAAQSELSGITDVAWVSAFVVAPAFLGRIIRLGTASNRELALRTELLAAERDERAASAVVEERQRIARELHDVVAHNVSIMVVQAAAVRRVIDRDRVLAARAFGTIEQTGREALTEMRQLLGMLREQDEALELAPQPGLDRLDELLDRARTAGLDVQLEVRGERHPLPASIDLTAYRVVQEALTNALKHASASKASVHLTYEDERFEVAVEDDGLGATAGPGSLGGTGNGLIGMRERVAACGGAFSAGTAGHRGFAVRASIPLEREAVG